MSQPYVGQISMFAGNFPPAGWMFCQGQLLPISENETLFNLIGTTFGGDGQSTFQLPDLQGRVPVHQGQGGGLSNYQIGQSGGNESVTLNTQQIPSHNHTILANNAAGTTAVPGSGATLANEDVNQGTNNPLTYDPFESANPNQVTMPANSIAPVGGSQPHENIQPILVLNYCISLFGVFPTQN